jgi:hypothetical protein
MQGWLQNLELAFAGRALELARWLPIVESGLSGLSVGVIPPALDQVLVGTIDRSRNPDLEMAVVMGLSEGVFPAIPEVSGLLTGHDRDELEQYGITLRSNLRSWQSRQSTLSSPVRARCCLWPGVARAVWYPSPTSMVPASGGGGSTPHWSRETASAGKVDWLAGSFDPAWYLQGRDLYGAATTPYKLRVRYKTSDATACDLGVYLEDGAVVSDVWSASAAAARQAVTLAGTSGTWAWASADVTAPCGSLTRVKIDATGPGNPELLSLACVALIENEG